MEVVSWERLTKELGVVHARVVGWNDAPALAAAARSAVSEQVAQDAEHYSSDDDFADRDDGELSNSRAAAALRRAPVLWRRHGVDVRAMLNVDDLSPLEDEARAERSAPRPAPPLSAAPLHNAGCRRSKKRLRGVRPSRGQHHRPVRPWGATERVT
jgi:hypothetical protein